MNWHLNAYLIMPLLCHPCLQDLFKKFGFTTGNVVDKAKALIKFYAGKPVPHLVVKPF